MKRTEFWTCNIDRRGRYVRLASGLLCLGAAAYFWWGRGSAVGAVVLAAFGALALFEALRGWCVVRAFGIKTRF